MSKISYIKYLAIFFLTFSSSFGLTKTIGNSARENKGFTREEAMSHLHKKVQSLCNAKFVDVKDTKGRTMFIDKKDWNDEYLILIDWDYSIRGRHELIFYSKEEYQNCIIEVGESEH